MTLKLFYLSAIVVVLVFLAAGVAPAQDDPAAAAGDDDDSAAADRDWSTVDALEGVTISTKATNIKSGTLVRVVVDNKRGESIFVLGCRPLQPEYFEADRWQSLPGDPCKTEGNGVEIKPGSSDMQVAAAGRKRMLFRATLTYGVGCTPGVPLSAAGCREFATVATGKVQVNPAD